MVPSELTNLSNVALYQNNCNDDTHSTAMIIYTGSAMISDTIDTIATRDVAIQFMISICFMGFFLILVLVMFNAKYVVPWIMLYG